MNIENIYDNVIRKTNDISQITGSMLYHHHMVKKNIQTTLSTANK